MPSPVQNPNSLTAFAGPPPPRAYRHGMLYLVLSVAGMLAIVAGVLIAVKNFNTEEDVLSTQIQAGCSVHGDTALVCPHVRNGIKSASSSADTLAGWKTYTNSQYGFSFMYPAEWIPNNLSAKQGTYFDEVSRPGMSATVNVQWHATSEFYNYSNLDGYINTNFDGIVSKQNKIVNGNTWIVIDSKPSWANGAEVLDALIQRGPYMYIIYSQKINPDTDLFNQVFSSFKFTK